MDLYEDMCEQALLQRVGSLYHQRRPSSTETRLESEMEASSFKRMLTAYVMRRYSERHRRYHTLDHILQCDNAAQTFPEAEMPPGVDRNSIRRALLMHDIVYDTHAKDNEAYSADEHAWFSGQVIAPFDAVHHECAMIRATTHDFSVEDPASQIVCDIDLMSLGSPRKCFVENTELIRQEYAWVPHDVFCTKRVDILQRFLDKEHIYYTPYYRGLYEEKARENLRLSIEALRRGELG